MRQEKPSIGHESETKQIQARRKDARLEDFVLEKSIFNNVFEKDIRRVFIYKKAERLAKALHLIAPAFAGSVSLKNRLDAVAVGLVDAAVVAPGVTLSRELLTLSSMLSMARTGGTLSAMNTELITREAHLLLQEVASYEEPRLSLDDVPTLSTLVKSTTANEPRVVQNSERTRYPKQRLIKDISDTNSHVKDRRETILSVIKDKRKASIKDISTLIRGISEKTVQRELSALIEKGIVRKEGERRWSTYSLA